ncbi:Uncharacterized protein APZ42_004235 [Daphnia magna]|uniref:Uncharacterized protein n=1 Tax=Daphnia magna TaxID=35525 RepID=A0A162F0S8_9CRUS|nr:Uncharacterized protein APZ42_004235 [Daphnia magna]
MQSTNEACSLTGTLTSTSCSLSTEAGENSSVSRKKKRTSWTWLHFGSFHSKTTNFSATTSENFYFLTGCCL